MKKKSFAIFLLALVAMTFTSCKKSRGIIFSSHFDNATDLNLWSHSSDGDAVVDSSVLKLRAVTGCIQLETVDLISVSKGKTYTLKFKGRVDPTLVGETGYCVGDYMIYVEQGSTDIIADGFGNYTGWTQKSFSFEATSSASVKIKFLIGTVKGAWIDDLELIEN